MRTLGNRGTVSRNSRGDKDKKLTKAATISGSINVRDMLVSRPGASSKETRSGERRVDVSRKHKYHVQAKT